MIELRQNYIDEVKQIREAISVSRYRAAKLANGETLRLYYSVGKFISQNTRNAKWGSGALKSISNQLQQEMPGLKGFSEGNMRKMRLFYEAWQPVFEPQVENAFGLLPVATHIELFDFHSVAPSIIRSQGVNETENREVQATTKRSPLSNELEDAKCSTPSNELDGYDVEAFLSVGFSIHSELIAHTKDLSERWFYIRKVANEFIGKRQLQSHLKHDLYHQQGTMPNNFTVTLTDEQQRAVAMQTFRENNVLDFQLAALYGVSTKVLNQAVRRNITRFPEDFMFQLDLQEFAKMRSQFVTSYSEQNDLQGSRGIECEITKATQPDWI